MHDKMYVSNMTKSLNFTIQGIEIQLFCYIIYSQVMGNENGLLTWSIPIIILYDAILVTIGGQ